MLTVVIADDVFALVVIALVYSDSIDVRPLIWAAGLFAVTLVLLLGRKLRRGPPYFVVGSAMWVVALESGIEPLVVGRDLARRHAGLRRHPARGGQGRHPRRPVGAAVVTWLVFRTIGQRSQRRRIAALQLPVQVGQLGELRGEVRSGMERRNGEVAPDESGPSKRFRGDTRPESLLGMQRHGRAS